MDWNATNDSKSQKRYWTEHVSSVFTWISTFISQCVQEKCCENGIFITNFKINASFIALSFRQVWFTMWLYISPKHSWISQPLIMSLLFCSTSGTRNDTFYWIPSKTTLSWQNIVETCIQIAPVSTITSSNFSTESQLGMPQCDLNTSSILWCNINDF